MTAPLPDNLRKQLGKSISAARREAEAGARKALLSLAVDRHEPHGSMSPEERKLRNRLRARGRQLGDALDKVRGIQAIDRLAHEVAYEHWHRMLFARFLAESGFLIEPESGVAISIEECEELAREANEDPRELAARFAQASLPQIFRTGDPVLEVTLAPETRRALERLLNELPREVFLADDSLGWTYQFWQTERKDLINKSGIKIGADELPAVTQLFTEHYMVLFLFHNSIGAWHAGRRLVANPFLPESAKSEEELRKAVKLGAQGGYDFQYLRFVRQAREGDPDGAPTGAWRPAAGPFSDWPRSAKELKVLDPCCGSGHFLVAGLELLVRLRMEEEELALEEAVRAVIAENLYGLEIDPRCTQIAAFNLALAAWKLAGRTIELPPLHIACSGLAVGSSRQEWVELGGDDPRLRDGMERLYALFEKAPVLGSLIDPRAIDGGSANRDAFQADFAELKPLLDLALERERGSEERTERAVAAQGMARAAELLSGQYTLAITNVPYLGRGQQNEILKAFAEAHYKEAKADLATVFVSRMLGCLGESGTIAAVTPQNWLFLTSYRKLREKLLRERTWNLVARLGPGAFETISGEVVNVALLVLSASMPSEDAMMGGIDVSAPRGQRPIYAREKARLLSGERIVETKLGVVGSSGEEGSKEEAGSDVATLVPGKIVLSSQAEQLKNPDAVIVFGHTSSRSYLFEHAGCYQGLTTADDGKWRRRFWEVACSVTDWARLQVPSRSRGLFSGREDIVNRALLDDRASGGVIRGREAWGATGVAIDRVGELARTLYSGDFFHSLIPVVIARKAEDRDAVAAFCLSSQFASCARKRNQALSIDNGYLGKLPFDVRTWRKVAAEKYPHGLPEPQSDDPTQWLFHGHPAKAEPARALQVAVARMLGYRWPPELDGDMRIAKEARAWVERCAELAGYADRDGIVCLTPIRGESSAADRLRKLLAAAFGPEWSPAKERSLLIAAAEDDPPAKSLEDWLRDCFFEEHCSRFHHRPFVWHIWDGRKDGFHALVNYHRLAGPNGEGRRTLEALAYSYLGDWISRQKSAQREGAEGSDARLAAAQDLQMQLEKILSGEPPYDIFVRWKSLHEQALGWDPDINDGVRLNIRPFLRAELRAGGRSGAGVLRWKPNINWKKDRGKEPESLRPKKDFPWFWQFPGEGTTSERTDFAGGKEFDGNRWNDLHYTRACKEAARERAGAKRESK